MNFKESLPEFYQEFQELLRKQNLLETIEQLPQMEISGRCDCGDSFCSTFYIKPLRQLNIVEQNIIGLHHGRTIDLHSEKGMVIIDFDNFEQLTTIEVLFRPDVEEVLEKVFKKTEKGS